jgi:hypothetical protein
MEQNECTKGISQEEPETDLIVFVYTWVVAFNKSSLEKCINLKQ